MHGRDGAGWCAKLSAAKDPTRLPLGGAEMGTEVEMRRMPVDLLSIGLLFVTADGVSRPKRERASVGLR